MKNIAMYLFRIEYKHNLYYITVLQKTVKKSTQQNYIYSVPVNYVLQKEKKKISLNKVKILLL